MKLQIIRIIRLLIVFFIAVSCSPDETNANRPNVSNPIARSLQVKKVTQITYGGSSGNDTEITDFIYIGNKLTGLHLTYNMIYTYDDELVYDGIKIIQINRSENGIPKNPILISYIGDLLTSMTYDFGQSRTDFTYLSGYLNSMKSYTFENGIPNLITSINYSYLSGNVSEEIKTDLFFSPVTSHILYTYDNKNSPLRGMNKYFRTIYSNEGFDGLSLNNPITRSYYNQGNGQNITNQHYVIEYNELNYPTNIKRLQENNNLISDTTIEYR